MILGHSRLLYAEVLERCDLVSFLEAHQRAFAYFGGVPREILYDRMRNVYLKRLHGKPQFTQGLQGLAVHYGFLPRVAPAYAPWVKGKVERPMHLVREDFWRGYLQLLDILFEEEVAGKEQRRIDTALRSSGLTSERTTGIRAFHDMRRSGLHLLNPQGHKLCHQPVSVDAMVVDTGGICMERPVFGIEVCQCHVATW
jgi:hypothetical protein